MKRALSCTSALRRAVGGLGPMNDASCRRLLVSAILASVALPGVGSVHAQQAPLPFNVTTVADLIDDNVNDGICHTSANTCSLRAALMQANHLSAPGVVRVNLPPGTYRLTRAPGTGADETHGDLDLTVPLAAGQSVIVDGAGAATTIIDANQTDRALDIGPGRIAAINGISVRNGLRDSGGGIQISNGTLSIGDSVIEANRAANSGGGIFNTSGTLNIVRSTIRSNVAGDEGGGVYTSGMTTIRASTIHDNGANEGGGINNSQDLRVVNSTISRNYALTDGGGIYTSDSTFLYSSSVINNDADHDRDELGGAGGGIYNRSGRELGVVNTLVVDNTLLDAPIYNDCHGPLTAYGLSLFSETSGCTPSGAWNTVPQGTVGALQDNGGPTLTHALHADAIAIDSTNDSLGCVDETGTPLVTEQRGAARVAGARCDVGAFEFGAVVDRIFRNGYD